MRRSRSEVIALILLATVAPAAVGQDVASPNEGGATFLLLPVGARAAALGQAGTADHGTSESVFWNPAGLATLPAPELGIHYSSTFASDNTALLADLPVKRLGVIGIAAYLVDFGSQEVVPGPGLPTGRISVRNVELLASYATQLTAAFGIGVNYKLIQFRQDCSGDCGTARPIVGTTHAVDFGVQYAFGTEDAFRVGLAVKHAGFKLQLENSDQADPLPTRVQFGLAYRAILARATETAPDVDARLLLDIQDDWGKYDDPDARIGVEFGYGQILRLRSGYAILHSETSGPSIGIGVQVGRVGVDFARIFYDSSSFDEPVYISLRVIL
jgi:hypothetical protein